MQDIGFVYYSWSTLILNSSGMRCECKFIWLFIIEPDTRVKKNSLIIELSPLDLFKPL